MKKMFLAILVLGMALGCSKKDGDYTFHLLTTGDCHGEWFSKDFGGDGVNNSLFAVKTVMDSIKAEYGAENVLSIDCGDALQGSEAAYLYNYERTSETHPFPEILSRIGYDAALVGNHDIETGHPVYDRLKKNFKEVGMKWLAGNAIDTETGKPYFDRYVIFRRNGIKIAVLGYTNPNIGEWLREELWSGIRFESLIPKVQEDVDELIARKHPDIVIVAAHSGMGKGNGKYSDNQGLDLFNSLKGVDFVVCAHDHRPEASVKDDMGLVDSGSQSRYLGHGTISLKVENGKVVSRSYGSEVLSVDKTKVDAEAEGFFSDIIGNVGEFACRKVGTLTKDIRTRDAYKGMCDYVNIMNYVSLKASGAQISFAAPLTYNATIKAGDLVYKDMSTLYQYENKLYKIKMTGKEIVDYLECSYDRWVQDPQANGGHVLRIINQADVWSGNAQWRFAYVPYNLDSAAGLCYTVDVTRPCGERVTVSSLADGTPFDASAEYAVAINSYRASGAGGMLRAAGVDSLDGRLLETYDEIRSLIYGYIKDTGVCDPDAMAADTLLGSWSFVPSEVAGKAIAEDMALLFVE